jgi:anti-sigma factor RsiW
MTGCHDLRPLLGAYVLDALEPDEAAAVREHLRDCPGCAAEHSRLAPLPGLLTLAAGADAALADPPPAALEERVLDVVAREAPRRRRRRLGLPRRLAWPAAGLVTAALAAGVVAIVLGGGAEETYGKPIPLRAAAGAPQQASGTAALAPVSSGTRMHQRVKGLRADAVYEVKCDAPGWTASAGTFRSGRDGSAYVELSSAARQGQYDAIRVVRSQDDRVVLWAPLS